MLRAACLIFVMASAGFGYIRQEVSGTTTPLVRVDNTAIQFYLNQQIAPGLQSSASGSNVTVITADSNPQQAVHDALATWNAVTTANIHFLPLLLTQSVIDPDDYQHTIAFGSTASDLSFVGGALAITIDSYVTEPANPGQPGSGPLQCASNCTYPAAGDIYDSDVILNPEYSFSTTGVGSNVHDLQATILHEMGHSLSANHTGILGASMFQFPTQHFLTTDDLTFVESAYPLPTGAAPLGTISGTVTVAGGGPAPYALLTAFDTTEGITVGGVTNPDGTYSFNVPPGNYQMYAEPLNGVVPINIYLTQAQLNQATGTAFQTTFYNGTVTVTAGSTQTANITATAGASTLAGPVVTAVQVNASVSGGSQGGPAVIPSGGSYDLILSGKGFDATLTASNFNFYSPVSLSIKSMRVDNSQMFGSSPLLRVTLNVAATSTPSLASFTVSSGGNTDSFSGSLVIVPPTPTFVAAGVVSAAPYTGIPGEVSPGGIYSIYDIPSFPNLGPNQLVQNGPYDSYGFLGTTLGGVTVTFDGVPAPLFLSFNGQLNFQVPFEVAGKTTTQVVVNYLGSSSASVAVPVVASQPLFFESCSGLCAVNLPSRTLNTAQNPAPVGSYVEIYGTGVGKVSYTILTGQATPDFPSGFTGNYTYTMGGSASAPAYFGGWTPTATGLAQWDLLVPAGIGTGAVAVVVQDASGASNQAQNAMLFVQ